MTIWYDVSDLMHWSLPHLTGIQRTTVGVLNGLVAEGVVPRLVRYSHNREQFEPLETKSLPAAIRCHLPWAFADCGSGTSLPPQDAVVAAAPPRRPKKRWASRETIFGTSPAAAELRTALRELKAASRQFRKRLFRWGAVRFGETTPSLPRPSPRLGARTIPQPLPTPRAAGPFQAGDVLLSLGASWSVPGHAEEAAALRSRGVVVVRMIYDMIPTIKPQWVDEPTVRMVSGWVRNLLTGSDKVLTISEFSRSEIAAYCAESHLAMPPVTVVRLGDQLDSSHEATPPLPRTVPQRPFFVCVSTLDVRKNHRLLYDAWSVLAARDPDRCPDLVCLGVSHLYVAELLREIRQDRAVNGRIHLLHGVADAELAWYYRHCAATIYPSRYEGWGLPVAESLGHGRLCLASQATSIPEISRDLPEFFDPLDVHGLVALVERTLSDPEWVQSREAMIRERFVPTPWTHTARQVLAAIAEATAGHSARDAA